MFKDKVILITGGTGSFGRHVLKRFLKRMFAKFAYLVVMRKAGKMRSEYNNTKLKFFIGDVRNYDSIYQALQWCAFCFPRSAETSLSCEFYPMEAVNQCFWRRECNDCFRSQQCRKSDCTKY